MFCIVLCCLANGAMKMPGWSHEIADEFIRLAVRDGRSLDQLQLQALVYIAHGWCLAMYGEPLTGDRPEAEEYGPIYRRLADALEGYGHDPVKEQILVKGASENPSFAGDRDKAVGPTLDRMEAALIAQIYQTYAAFESWQLSGLTRKGNSPWKQIIESGAGKFNEIPHHLIRAQFVELLQQSEEQQASP
jgi:uncharacterized phage-associated protein